MDVLVTGANGFVGGAVCRAFLARGHAVRAAVRSGADPARITGKRVDVETIGPDTAWALALTGVEAVVHCAARAHHVKDRASDPLAEYRLVNVEGTRRLAREAAACGVRRFVFISSMKVNGDESGATPFVETGAGPVADPYGLSKWEAEEALRAVGRDSDMGISVIRPPLVYGPGVQANFLRLVQLVDRGVPLPFGLVANRRSLVALHNLADAIVTCVLSERAIGQAFQVADAEVVSTGGLIRRIARALGKPPRLLPVPSTLLRSIAMLARRPQLVPRLLGSFELDTSKIRQLLGWAPPVSMNDTLDEVAAWFRGRRAQA